MLETAEANFARSFAQADHIRVFQMRREHPALESDGQAVEIGEVVDRPRAAEVIGFVAGVGNAVRSIGDFADRNPQDFMAGGDQPITASSNSVVSSPTGIRKCAWGFGVVVFMDFSMGW